MPIVEVNGVPIHYETSGTGRPVLFIHGLGSSTRDWERQVERFSDAYQMITVDLRGHGRSGKPAGSYSIGGFAEDVAVLLDQLDGGALPVVGISLGAMVGFQMAADRPDLVESLMAINAVQGFEVKSVGMKTQIAIRKLIARFAGMEKIGEILAGRLFPDEDMGAERELMAERWAENDKQAYQASLQAILDWPGVVDEMSRFEKPIVVVASDQDYTPVETKQPYVDRMPSAELVVIENAHHAVPVERPEKFNAVLKDFLTS
ncbi:MAG: alpha/beta hydrolase [Actinomycetota bacterium]|nr:alpha/beta hydrolase [Actinomycetota bacterium]